MENNTENKTSENNSTDQAFTETPSKATSLGMEENIEGLLCYLLGWVSALVFLFAEKNSKFVRFHAIQSLALGIAVTVAYFILDSILLNAFWFLWGFVSLVTSLIGLGYLALSIILMVKAYHKEQWQLPIIGPFAEKSAYNK